MEKREYAGARKSYLRPIGNQAACSDNRSYDQMHKQIQRAMERTQSVLADVRMGQTMSSRGVAVDGPGRGPAAADAQTEDLRLRTAPDRACGCGQRQTEDLWLWTAPEPRTCGCGQRPEPGGRLWIMCARPEAACGCQKPIAVQQLKMGDAILLICENVPLV
ncbi:MAG: hypothetical protein ACLTDS_13880 [Bianqueaceae bacterium]